MLVAQVCLQPATLLPRNTQFDSLPYIVGQWNYFPPGCCCFFFLPAFMNPELLLVLLAPPLLFGCWDLRGAPPPGCVALTLGAGAGPEPTDADGSGSARRPPSLYFMKSVAKFVTYQFQTELFTNCV